MKHTSNEELFVKNLLSPRDRFFFIPHYQREYCWSEDKCATMWNDFTNFALPDTNSFNANLDEYYFGVAVIFENEEKQFEVVDGQQRITSLLLLIRALYDELDTNTDLKNELARCIWQYDFAYQIDFSQLKIFVNDVYKERHQVLEQILLTGSIEKSNQSPYAKNFRFFQQVTLELKRRHPSELNILAGRILDSVYILLQRADSQNTALQLFRTNNDRGLSLRIADIFKAEICSHLYTQHGMTESYQFATDWDALSAHCKKIYENGKSLSPIEYHCWIYTVLFKQKVREKELKMYYEQNNYALLKDPQTFKGLNSLMDFFQKLSSHNTLFDNSAVIKRQFYILQSFKIKPTWFALASFFFTTRDNDPALQEEKLLKFLNRIIAYVVGSAVCERLFEVNRLQTEIVNIMPMLFGDKLERKFHVDMIRSNMSRSYEISSQDRFRRIILSWWTFKDETQPLVPLKLGKATFNNEHIFSRALAEKRVLVNANTLELMGNLALLEPSINNKCKDAAFKDKRHLYLNHAKGKDQKGTANVELRRLAEAYEDFTEADIRNRNEQITSSILELLEEQNMLIK